MVAASYEFKVDTKRDGTYGATIDDLTSRLIGQALWNTGMSEAYQDFAPPARLTVQLDNIDGAFNPDTLGSELVSNGNFASWTADNPNSWTVTGEVGSDPEVSQVGASELNGGAGTGACNLYSTSSAVSISQTILTIGTSYKVMLDISAAANSAGYIGVYDNATLISPRYHFTGKYTFYFNATSTTFKIALTGACNMTIDNVSVKATSVYGYLLNEGTLGRLRATFNAVTYVLYTGRLSSYQITAGSNSRRVATLQFNDPMYDLLDTEYIPPLSLNVTTDQPLTTLFDNPIIPFPYAHSYWLLGIQGTSELDLTTYLYDPPSYTFDTGKTTYGYVGDNTVTGDQGGSAQQFIRDIVAGEVYGRFFYDPSLPGYIFHNRHRDGLNATVTFTATEQDYEPDSSVYVRESVVNTSKVTYQPRKAGTAGTVIWSSDSTIGVTSEPVKITARYRDLSNPSARVGATNVLPLLAGTDYAAVQQPDLFDVTNYVGISMVVGANSAEITIYNPNSFAFVVTRLQIRGTPITTFDSRTVQSINGDSQRANKATSEQINLSYVNDNNFAQTVADYRVNKFADPVSSFQVLGWVANKTDSRMTNALNLEVGQRITITDSWLNHNADYIVVGFRHTVTWGGDHTHETAAILKPYFREASWILDTSTLGTDTKLGL